jgi:hypothetical protein
VFYVDFENNYGKDWVAEPERFGMIWAFLVNSAPQRRACS